MPVGSERPKPFERNRTIAPSPLGTPRRTEQATTTLIDINSLGSAEPQGPGRKNGKTPAYESLTPFERLGIVEGRDPPATLAKNATQPPSDHER
ncbi:hypothetical protein SAMN05444166_3216 [Singulisphaera sp. GP187]|uniref:hypothetical protein n=1 Tax=Singulisphaera sp. GP187 TaxID=1882752 RepID=UPI0009280DE4|nr:hypothetical protein [Singulisphaera sp. GP187]SIO24535.1 hypothetical protein SAMN05444166_3216 [Singulisphaera sp. GP187]